MNGQKYGPKWVKPLRIEKNKIGKMRSQKLDNARRLRGIYFVDPDDQDYEETLKHARRILKSSLAVAISCKRKARTGNTKVVEEEIAPQNVKKNI